MVECGHRAKSKGQTLVEVMVALGLIAVALMLILGMIPAGIQSSQRAADVQAAASWTRELIEDTPPPSEFPIPSDLARSEHKEKVGSTYFSAVRTVKVTGAYLYRIEVETTWDAAVEPVKLSLTRFNPAGPDRMRRGRAGFTLVEVMVASVLALMVLTLVIELFIPALRAWGDGQRRSEVGQRLLVTTTWLGEDVVRASPGSIRLTDEGTLVMKCAKGQTTDHTNPFTLFVAYWMEGGEIWRVTQDLADPDAEVASTMLVDLKGLPDRRRVAANVTSFEITIPQPWRVQMHLAVDKEGRTGEIKTAYSSIYSPLDLAIAAENEEETPKPKP